MQVFELPKRIRTAALSMRRTPRPGPPPVSCAGAGGRPPGRSSGETGEVRSGFCPVPRGHGGGRREEEAPQAEQAQGEAPAAPAESPLPAQAPARPKLTRPGTRLETGSAMPCTEFDRPDPWLETGSWTPLPVCWLPCRLTLPGILQGGARAPPKALCWTGRSAPPEERGPEGPLCPHRPQAESRKPAPSKHKKKSSQGRGQDRRRSFQDPPRPTGHPKDSTEQESLMKPYYLDI